MAEFGPIRSAPHSPRHEAAAEAKNARRLPDMATSSMTPVRYPTTWPDGITNSAGRPEDNRRPRPRQSSKCDNPARPQIRIACMKKGDFCQLSVMPAARVDGVDLVLESRW